MTLINNRDAEEDRFLAIMWKKAQKTQSPKMRILTVRQVDQARKKFIEEGVSVPLTIEIQNGQLDRSFRGLPNAEYSIPKQEQVDGPTKRLFIFKGKL